MTQFVYFYVQAPDSGEELKLSMASVKKNFIGEPTFTVIGERPTWYTGHCIELKQFKGIRDNAARMPFRDTQHKIITAANHPDIDEEFVWIMDDCFMLKPTSLEDMKVPRYDPWYKVNVRTTWHQIIRMTFAALSKAGKSNLQYGTHLPHVFRKKKLLSMFQAYKFPQTLLLFEILYANHYHNPDKAIPYGANWNGVDYPLFLKRLLRPMTRKELDAVDANFLNYQSKCWTTEMKLWLRSRFDSCIS